MEYDFASELGVETPFNLVANTHTDPNLHTSNAYATLQVDNRHQEEPVLTPEQAVKVLDRNFGVGGDGVSPPLLTPALCLT